MREGHIEWEGHRTWCRIVGATDGGRPPLVITHGGPGLTHDYLEPLASLADGGRACIFYNQIGSGRSDRLPDAPAGFWTGRPLQARAGPAPPPARGRRRLPPVRPILGGETRAGVGARSARWARQPRAGEPPGEHAFSAEEVARLRDALPPEIREPLERQGAGTIDDPEYRSATIAFYERHLLRVRWPDEIPDFVGRTFAALREDRTIYAAMVGPSEFHVVGTLRDWDVSARLGEIEVPALLLSGRHDEVTPPVVAQLDEGLPHSEWVLFEESSHMPHVEETERSLEIVGSFLDRVDEAQASENSGW